MTWIDQVEVRISTQQGRQTAELRGGAVLRYEPVEVPSEQGGSARVCPTVDHLVAAAGW